ncbi:hypothetical protein OK18_08765 [Chryseobacterium gallinarum]|uniref:Uncharacterized protein n=1 Tax=Chryseobacterium gallinarum TaxID=1324352 RepID=A0A0G3M3U6_CHRGL|nr:hypothetical protein [Chryseobacterium gallinarum]AKK72703.1 hypothetical protein OK18_08765 [Chryseobacterium gallinarum]
MSIKTIKQLKEQGMKYTIIDGETYFLVEDVKKNEDYLIVDLTQVIHKNGIDIIHEKYIHELSDFDKMIKRTLKKED